MRGDFVNDKEVFEKRFAYEKIFLWVQDKCFVFSCFVDGYFTCELNFLED